MLSPRTTSLPRETCCVTRSAACLLLIYPPENPPARQRENNQLSSISDVSSPTSNTPAAMRHVHVGYFPASQNKYYESLRVSARAESVLLPAGVLADTGGREPGHRTAGPSAHGRPCLAGSGVMIFLCSFVSNVSACDGHQHHRHHQPHPTCNAEHRVA